MAKKDEKKVEKKVVKKAEPKVEKAGLNDPDPEVNIES